MNKEKSKNIAEWIVYIIGAIIIALLFKYYIITPTVVSGYSMYSELEDGERLIVNRTFRITGNMPERYDIVTFEAPSYIYNYETIDQENPVAIYQKDDRNAFSGFVYNVLEITKTSYIKRVIALPGEHVQIKNGKVYINGEELEENYLQTDTITESELFNDFIVPDRYLFCMGDNRQDSMDSRVFGCIPIEKIEGTVMLRFFPLDKINSF